MKIKSSTVIKRFNGRPVMIDQEIIIVDGQPLMLNGIPQLSGGHELTVGDVISNILTTKKVDQFNTLKAYALAQRFYNKSEATDLDNTDYSALREVVEKNDQYVPLVLAQVLQSLLDAKDKGELPGKKPSSRH
jgi:hypothetical protein